MDGKRNDFIEGNDFVLYVEKVIVSPLNQSNIEGYLSTYKRASAFAEIYERMPDFGRNSVNGSKIARQEEEMIRKDT